MPKLQGSSPPVEPARRPIATRSSRIAIGMASWLARSRVTPNQISVFSVVAALAGSAILVAWDHAASFILATLAVQLRLLCNLLDGMVAIEGGKKSAVGALYNEFPDRIADTAFLVAAGWAAGLPDLGWACALLAALTAYIRVFGGSLGLVQSFGGVMAKQRRMAVLTLALLAQAIERIGFGSGWTMLSAGLAIIAIGSLVTCLTRTVGISRLLRAA